MDDASASDDRIFGIQLAAVAALVGAIVGAVLYLSLSGVLVGLLVGLGVCGALMLLASVFGFPLGVPATIKRSRATVTQGVASAPVTGVASAMVQAASTAATGATAMTTEQTEIEAEFLNKGQFAEYHLAKAKRLFAAGNLKDAAYQAGASLCHGDLAEAVELRKTALAGAR